MERVDYLTIITYFLILFEIAAFYSGREGKITEEFFSSGGNRQVKLFTISVLSATITAITPLAMTELISNYVIL